jgi:hypothetical protein
MMPLQRKGLTKWTRSIKILAVRQECYFCITQWVVCGCSSIGRTLPCQGRGRGFEPHRPLFFEDYRLLIVEVRINRQFFTAKFHRLLATWPSGKARVCKTLITGSNPVVASFSSKSYTLKRSRQQGHDAKSIVAFFIPISVLLIGLRTLGNKF